MLKIPINNKMKAPKISGTHSITYLLLKSMVDALKTKDLEISPSLT